MSGNKSSDDCYFYFYSTCTKGDKCPFRHCEAALGKEVVCTLWKEGQCFRDNCQFRHMECKKNRSQIPCYWETQPGGCRKPHCVFLHTRPRSPDHGTYANSPGAGYMGSPVQQAAHLTSQQMAGMAQPGLEEPGSTVDSSSVTQPIEPVVVNFDDQESDNESTPTKLPLRGQHSQLETHELSGLEKTPSEEIGVKTLEQIRLERIHKESPNIYETTPVVSEEEEDDVASVDLRKHLKRKYDTCSTIPDLNGTETGRRVVKLKPQEVADVTFHIKTLDEIRREKESKIVSAVESLNLESSLQAEMVEMEESVKDSTGNNPVKKRRINRLIKVEISPETGINTGDTNKSSTKNCDAKVPSDESKTDILEHNSTFRRRILKRKVNELNSIAEKKTKAEEKEVTIASVVSHNSSENGDIAKDGNVSFLMAHSVIPQTTSPSCLDLPQENSFLREQMDYVPETTSEEKPGSGKKRDERTVSLTGTEDDLDFLLDEDDVEDVPEDEGDDVLLQELENIINS